MTFDEFVKAVYNISDQDAEPHFRSQYTFLIENQGKYLVDYIGYLETIQKDFLYICSRLDVEQNMKLPHILKTKRSHYRQFYNEKTISMVQERYKRDIQDFGYSF